MHLRYSRYKNGSSCLNSWDHHHRPHCLTVVFVGAACRSKRNSSPNMMWMLQGSWETSVLLQVKRDTLRRAHGIKKWQREACVVDDCVVFGRSPKFLLVWDDSDSWTTSSRNTSVLWTTEHNEELSGSLVSSEQRKEDPYVPYVVRQAEHLKLV